MPGKLRRSRKRVLEKQWQSLEEKGTVGAQLGHSLLTRSKTCDPSFGKETEQAVATTGAQGYASPCPSPSLTKHTASYHKAFGELAKQEALLACFSCAWQREMPYRGRLYISSHHICFHSSLLLKDIKVVVPVASISALKKTNMALLVPNALSIRTAEGEKQFLFVSLRQREATYQLLKSVCRQLQTSSHSDLEQSVPEPDSLQELPDGMTLVPGQAEQKDGGEAEALSGSSAAPVPFARPCSLQAGGPHTTLWAWTAMQLSPLNVIILIYLLLMVALLLSSGYIGLRISELEQQLASMGAWPDLNLPHQDKRT
ncbi:GRAM domain-containing protein 2A-like isoform X5 [Pogoniulus pusillus]|uniref:GRAM domain-containing protein 2A-like isoform X5 n=1 Tax=Pogoniulus pusillus TaxID=488313 RepID=UPI0030B969F3